MKGSTTVRLVVLIAFLASLLLGACGPQPTEEVVEAPKEEPTKAPTATSVKIAVASPAPATPTVQAGEEEISTGTFTMVKTNDPNSIDPHVHDGWYSIRVQSGAYEALVDMVWNPDTQQLEFLPSLAKDWEISDDGLTYTFHLEEGVKFTDGCDFNAEAVKKTFERNKGMALRAAYQVDPIEEIETPDDHTVILHLSYPYTPFIMAMSRALIMSPCAIEANATEEDEWAQEFFNENMIGTGPYILTNFVRESIIEMEKNPDYWRGWGGKHFDRLVMKHVPERATHSLLIERGEADLVDNAPYDDLERLDALPNVVVRNNPGPMPFVWMMRPRGPLEDVRVRQALAYAIDYDAIIEEVMQGTGTRLYGPLSQVYGAYCEDGLIKYEYDLDKAKELLKEAGYEDGFDLNFTFPIALPFEQDVAVALQGMWAPLGINLTLEPQASSATYMSASYTWEEPKKYDAFGMLLSAYLPDPDHQLWRWIGEDNWPGLNVSAYENERVNEIFRQARQMPMGPERDALYCEASEIINQDAVHLWMFTKNDVRTWQEDIKGYVYNPVDAIREYRYYDLYREK